MKKFEFLSHTADLKFRIYGKDLKEIINNSLLALKEFFEPELTHEKIGKEIEIESTDKVVLIINFLSEVLTQTYISKAIFLNFEGEIFEDKLKGKIIGYKFTKLKKDIKAITYHQAKLEKIDNLFIFEFIVDI